MTDVIHYIDRYLDRSEGKKRYNCAEAVFLAANDAWHLESAEMVKMMYGFGGGMCSGIVCGAVSGGVAALTLKYQGDTQLKQKIKQFVTLVREKLESENCNVLKPKYFNREIFCDETIRLVTAILDEVEHTQIDTIS